MKHQPRAAVCSRKHYRRPCMPPPAPLPVDACLMSMQSRKPTNHPTAHARAQEIKELRGGGQAWNNSGISHAFKTVDAVPRKKAPALERAKRGFGTPDAACPHTHPTVEVGTDHVLVPS